MESRLFGFIEKESSLDNWEKIKKSKPLEISSDCRLKNDFPKI